MWSSASYEMVVFANSRIQTLILLRGDDAMNQFTVQGRGGKGRERVEEGPRSRDSLPE